MSNLVEAGKSLIKNTKALSELSAACSDILKVNSAHTVLSVHRKLESAYNEVMREFVEKAKKADAEAGTNFRAEGVRSSFVGLKMAADMYLDISKNDFDLAIEKSKTALAFWMNRDSYGLSKEDVALFKATYIKYAALAKLLKACSMENPVSISTLLVEAHADFELSAKNLGKDKSKKIRSERDAIFGLMALCEKLLDPSVKSTEYKLAYVKLPEFIRVQIPVNA